LYLGVAAVGVVVVGAVKMGMDSMSLVRDRDRERKPWDI
jgi:hypothetical protein